MTFKAQLQTDNDDVFYDTDIFAQTVTYDGVEIPATVTIPPSGNIGESVASLGQIRVKVSDVTEPDYRDTVVIGSDTWYVYQDQNVKWRKTACGLNWIIPISRDERPYTR